jgi:hypothetical protein
MSKPLDTKKLKELCEAVIRDIGSDTSIPLAADWNWARLEHESLPELENFLADDAITATQQATIARLERELGLAKMANVVLECKNKSLCAKMAAVDEQDYCTICGGLMAAEQEDKR